MTKRISKSDGRLLFDIVKKCLGSAAYEWLDALGQVAVEHTDALDFPRIQKRLVKETPVVVFETWNHHIYLAAMSFVKRCYGSAYVVRDVAIEEYLDEEEGTSIYLVGFVVDENIVPDAIDENDVFYVDGEPYTDDHAADSEHFFFARIPEATFEEILGETVDIWCGE